MELPTKPTPAKTEDQLKKNQFATHETFIRKEQVDEFEDLLEKNASETTMDAFLAKNPEVFTAALNNFRTGHHGTVVIPKQNIRPNIKPEELRGLIPDFLIGGDSSDGWSWWVVEIKGVDQTLFSQTGLDTYLNVEINKGVCQLLEYIDFCSAHQATLRDLFKLEGFREPNGLLIAGRSGEIEKDNKKRELKAAWNKITQGKLEIRTFDFIGRVLRRMYELHNKS